MRFTPLSLMISSLLFPAAHTLAYDRVTGMEFASRSEVIATQAMAATNREIAGWVLASGQAHEALHPGGND